MAMFTLHTVLAYNIFFVFLVHNEIYRLACLLTWLGAKLQFNTGMKTERHDSGWGVEMKLSFSVDSFVNACCALHSAL